MGFVIDKNTVIRCDENDHEGLNIVAGWVREDLRKVFGDPDGGSSGVIIVGSMEKSGLIKGLLIVRESLMITVTQNGKYISQS